MSKMKFYKVTFLKEKVIQTYSPVNAKEILIAEIINGDFTGDNVEVEEVNESNKFRKWAGLPLNDEERMRSEGISEESIYKGSTYYPEDQE